MIFLKMFSRKWILTTVLVVLGALVCVRLGIWQLDRLAQRRVFNAQVNTMRSSPPLDLPAQADLTKMEWRAVRLEGTYDFDNQVAIRNQYNENESGYHLLTPLHLPDGEAVFVDRGWIPADGNDNPSDWRKYDQTGEIVLSGIIRLSETSTSFGGAPDPTLTPNQTGLDFWIYVNLDRIAQQTPYPILPVYVQLDPEPDRTDPPIPFQPELDLSEGPHEGYAIQWFAFAGLLLIGYPFYLRKQESEKK
jgi:surfeit locus 1 family protein